ncbi:MAG TPA: response regulator, partial [Amycolatopsis sp.]|nr:response regulator [Amycolatopsis sp.]
MNEQAGRVLVVDDDETVRDVVRRYLEVAGFTVEMAGDGTEGLAKFAAAEPDLVVLDVMMPGLNGLEVCRRLRLVSQVPIVML